MSSAEELELLIQERLRAYDSTIRLETGTPADIQVVQPLVRRLEPDPLEMDVDLFITERLSQEYPDLFLGEGSPVKDLLVKAMQLLLEPLIREIRAIRRQQTLLDPTVLNKDEADSLVSNVFVTRLGGDYARVRVRLYFEHATSVNLGSFHVAFTSSGRRFVPLGAQRITSEAMLFNQDGDLYYFDADYVAEGRGAAYNIGASEILGMTNMPAAVRVTNMSKASLGQDEETTVELVTRAEKSIGERSLTTSSGIVSRLFELFPALRILQVIGFGDEEMQRDVISGGSLGAIEVWGVDGATVDDGDADGYTPYFDSAGALFTTELGPVGTDLTYYTLTAFWSTGPEDYQLGSVKGATQLEISSGLRAAFRFPSGESSVPYTVRKREILLNGVPGGLLNPTEAQELTIKPDEVHVGGCTDIYVIGSSFEDKTVAFDQVAGDTAVSREPGAATTATARTVVLSNVSQDVADVVAAGTTVLRLVSGADTGTYRIIASSYASPNLTVTLPEALSTTDTGVLYELHNDLTLSLNDPEEVLVAGTDLQTFAGSDLVDTTAGTVWGDYGVTTDHFLRILNGDDEGLYSLATVSGSTLFLNVTLGQTASPIQYEVVRRQTAGVELPLARVTSVELLDADLEPTGDFIPYRHPVDARSFSFQNPGRGAKAGSDTTVTNDTVAVVKSTNPRILTSSLTSANYYDLGVRAGDLVNILTGDNSGYYTVATGGVGGSVAGAANGLTDYELLLTEDLAWDDAAMQYAVGEPSYGSFRLYFRDPVSFSVTSADTLIEVTSSGVSRRFRPDPEVRRRLLPTDATKLVFETTVASAQVTMTNHDTTNAVYAELHSLAVGDRVEITFAPIVGSKDMGSSSHGTSNGTMLFDLGLGSERVRFSDDLTIDEIVDEINTQLSRDVAAVLDTGGAKYVSIDSSEEVVLQDNSADGSDVTDVVMGTTPVTNNPWLSGVPTFAGETISNDAPNKGLWFISALSDDTLDLEDVDGTALGSGAYTTYAATGHYAVITRLGEQRISATAMADQQDAVSLYYFDVECISEGYGDTWNISAELRGTVTGYTSQGYNLTVADERLSYSMAEEVTLTVTPWVLISGELDDPANEQSLAGASYQISYERSDLTENVQALVDSTQERVTCQNPLVRTLLPVFVRAVFNYAEGPTEATARADIASAILDVAPEERLEASDLISILTRQGATHVGLPVELVGLSYQEDRSITVERSEDSLVADRLSAFLPDDEGTAEGASLIVVHRA
jgi:hypothetical protein